MDLGDLDALAAQGVERLSPQTWDLDLVARLPRLARTDPPPALAGLMPFVRPGLTDPTRRPTLAPELIDAASRGVPTVDLLEKLQGTPPELAVATFEEYLKEWDRWSYTEKAADEVRGRYVALRFTGNGTASYTGEVQYGTLVVDEEGFAEIDEVLEAEPESGPYIKTHTGEVPFDRFYMNEKLAPEAEAALRNREAGTVSAFLEVRVLNGDAVPVELYIDNLPASEYIRR